MCLNNPWRIKGSTDNVLMPDITGHSQRYNVQVRGSWQHVDDLQYIRQVDIMLWLTSVYLTVCMHCMENSIRSHHFIFELVMVTGSHSSSLLDHLHNTQSTLSGITAKRKPLGITATQPWSGRPCKVTERGIVGKSRQHSYDSVTTALWASWHGFHGFTFFIYVAFKFGHRFGFNLWIIWPLAVGRKQ